MSLSSLMYSSVIRWSINKHTKYSVCQVILLVWKVSPENSHSFRTLGYDLIGNRVFSDVSKWRWAHTELGSGLNPMMCVLVKR